MLHSRGLFIVQLSYMRSMRSNWVNKGAHSRAPNFGYHNANHLYHHSGYPIHIIIRIPKPSNGVHSSTRDCKIDDQVMKKLLKTKNWKAHDKGNLCGHYFLRSLIWTNRRHKRVDKPNSKKFDTVSCKNTCTGSYILFLMNLMDIPPISISK